jgi:PAS domain S-box-containing protein
VITTARKILVVQDEAETLAKLLSSLEDAGYKVVGAKSGRDALVMIRLGYFDAIVADADLPDFDGLAILEQAKKANPDVVVVLETAQTDTGAAVECLKHGAGACFVKPVSEDELKTSLANALKQQQLSQDNRKLIEDLQKSNKLLAKTNEELRLEIANRERAEELYSILANSSPVGVYIAVKGRFRFVNPQFRKYTGFSEEELFDKETLSIVYPEDRETVRYNAIQMLKGQRSTPYEFRAIVQGGEVRWAMETVTSVTYLGKRATLGNFMDITERKRAEEALKESEKRFRELADLLPQAVWETDAAGNFTFFNRRGFLSFGYSPGEIIGSFNALDVFLPEDRGRVRKDLQMVLAGEQLAGKEYTVVRKDGSTFPVIVYAAPIFQRGQRVGLRGIALDITERKRAEETLRQSEEKLKVYLESGPDGVYLIDLKGRFLYGNKKAEEIIGLEREQLIGKSFLALDLLSAKHLIKAGKLLALNMMGKSTGPDEFELRRRDGRSVWVEISTTPIKQDGEVVVIGFVRDITERKRMQRELEERSEQLLAQQQQLLDKTEEVARANQLKSQFLASMSHELRTPLNAVIGFSELMLDEVPGKINEDQRQCLTDILQSSRHLLSLINEVLDLSKIESGRLEFRQEELALTEVLEALTRTMMPILTPRQQSLDISLEEGLPPIRSDKGRLGQVLLNLLDNASKFTPDGGKLRVEAVRDGDWCQISVIDNGIGIQKEDRERIFEPFSRLDNPLGRQRGGTGLGLTLVKQIVEKYGGKIWVDNEHGPGSRFTFTLPFVAGAKSNPEKKNDE